MVFLVSRISRAVARTLIGGGGGGGCIFIYSGSARLVSFEIKLTSKEGLYRYVTRTNVSFFDPSPNDQRTEYSCA